MSHELFASLGDEHLVSDSQYPQQAARVRNVPVWYYRPLPRLHPWTSHPRCMLRCCLQPMAGELLKADDISILSIQLFHRKTHPFSANSSKSRIFSPQNSAY